MLLITIKHYDEETGVVNEQEVHTHSGSYGWEIEKHFTQLGEKWAKKIDNQYDG